jgi:hypothetical protein
MQEHVYPKPQALPRHPLTFRHKCKRRGTGARLTKIELSALSVKGAILALLLPFAHFPQGRSIASSPEFQKPPSISSRFPSLFSASCFYQSFNLLHLCPLIANHQEPRHTKLTYLDTLPSILPVARLRDKASKVCQRNKLVSWRLLLVPALKLRGEMWYLVGSKSVSLFPY